MADELNKTTIQFKCEFCGKPSSLLCDGRLDDGRTCNANICRACTTRVSAVFTYLSRRDPKTGHRCGHDTVDLCPRCREAGRDTNWGGMSKEEALRVLDKTPKPEQGALFAPPSRDYADD